MWRALEIDEKSYGLAHPNLAIHLNNLAQLFKDTRRLEEAEPLIRRHLKIFVQFTAGTGHKHTYLHAVIANYSFLLREMDRSPGQIGAQLEGIGGPFGMLIRFGKPGNDQDSTILG